MTITTETQTENGGAKKENVALLQEQKDALLGLIRHPGWRTLCELLTEAAELRIKVVLEPSTSQHELILKEYMKGAAWAFRRVEQLSIETIEQNSDLIREILDAEELERMMHPQQGEE